MFRFTFQAFLFQSHIADIQAVNDSSFYFKKFVSKSTRSSSSSFYNAESSNWQESSFYSKYIQLVIHYAYASHRTRDFPGDQGHSFRTRILRGRSNRLTEFKFYIVYIVYGLIQVSLLQTST